MVIGNGFFSDTLLDAIDLKILKVVIVKFYSFHVFAVFY